MDKEEKIKEFEKSVEYLRQCVPPDDIYEFTQMLMISSTYFITYMIDHINLAKACEDDPVLNRHIKSMANYVTAKQNGIRFRAVYKYGDQDV